MQVGETKMHNFMTFFSPKSLKTLKLTTNYQRKSEYAFVFFSEGAGAKEYSCPHLKY